MKKKKPNKRWLTTLQRYGTELAEKQGGWYCHYCWCFIALEPKSIDSLRKPAQATIDHKIPLSKGGANRLKNMVLACRECNWEKGDGDYAAFYAQTAHYRKPARIEYQRPRPRP